MIALKLGHTERDGVVIADGLHDAVEVVCIQTHIQLGCGMVVFVMLKLVCVEAHVCEDSSGVVHRNHANTILIEDKTHLDQHGLQTLRQSANRGSLHGFSYDEFV